MSAFIYLGVDLQLIHHLWLLPCAGIGHLIGLRFHQAMANAESSVFMRVVGSALLVISTLGLLQAVTG